MKRETAEKITLLAFAGYLMVFFLLQFIIKDREFSARENRYLQMLPEFSFESLFKGSYTGDFEDYCADQFPFRDQWITLNARYELLSGKKQTNGIYLCEGERLIKPFTAPDENELERRVQAVELLREKLRVPLTLALIPDGAELYGEQLPEGAPNDSQGALIEQVRASTDMPVADLLTPLREGKAAGGCLFYRTDHHWTTLGAYYGYQGLSRSLGLTPRSLDSYNRRTVAGDFYGTAYSASGYTWVAPDSIERFVDPDEAATLTRYDSAEGTEAPLYREESLHSKDKYTYFLGGNSPRSVLRGTDDSLPRLLILRDSYCDALAPFLLEHYSEIHLLDMRYYLGSPEEYARENNIDQVLVLYSVANFCEQNSVFALAE